MRRARREAHVSPASCPAPRSAGDIEGLPRPRRARAVPFTAKKAIPHVARGVPPVGIMGKMPMPRRTMMASFSFSSLRPCAFALLFSSLFLSTAKAGYPPETESIRFFQDAAAKSRHIRRASFNYIAVVIPLVVPAFSRASRTRDSSITCHGNTAAPFFPLTARFAFW